MAKNGYPQQHQAYLAGDDNTSSFNLHPDVNSLLRVRAVLLSPWPPVTAGSVAGGLVMHVRHKVRVSADVTSSLINSRSVSSQSSTGLRGVIRLVARRAINHSFTCIHSLLGFLFRCLYPNRSDPS
ncbi:hypothetical protein FS749_006660 [Ceratobasidium sp. UAMH 11750]|nr:hypothetical protein FS749_006660 [Ceratobasidium sp. UAMH 11750]